MIRWKNTRSSRWVDAGFRARVETFAQTFLQTHGWADTIQITERFNGDQTRIDIWRRKTDANGVPTRGPDNEPYREGANQSDNIPLLLFRVTAEGVEVHAEVGVEFPDGRETSDSDLNLILDQVRLSLEAAGP